MKISDIALIGLGGLAIYYLSSNKAQATGTSGGGTYLNLPAINLPGINVGTDKADGGLGLSDVTDLFGGFTDAISKVTGALSGGGGGGVSSLLSGLTSAKAENTKLTDIFDPTKAVTEGLESFGKGAEVVVSKALDSFTEKALGLIEDIIREVPESTNTAGTKKTTAASSPPSEKETEQSVGIDITAPAVLTSLRQGLGIAARQYGGALLTGTHLLKPLPLAKPIEEIGAKLITRGLEAAGAKAGASVAVKVVGKAIPIIGWVSMIVDAGADFLRVFGLDMPESLGFSSLATPFMGKNPIEAWVKGAEAGAETGKVKTTESSSDKTTSEKPIPYKLNDIEAGNGPPERSTSGIGEDFLALDLSKYPSMATSKEQIVVVEPYDVSVNGQKVASINIFGQPWFGM